MMATDEDIKGGASGQSDRHSIYRDEKCVRNEEPELELEKTLPVIDIENRAAYKGDNSDGQVEWRFSNIMASIFLCMLFTGKLVHTLRGLGSAYTALGSQLILYFVGGSLEFIVPDLKAQSTAAWLPISNTLAVASIAPYTGYLQDLFGKRYIALFGALLICIGIVVLGTAHDFAQGVAGMAMAGAGAAIGELTGLSGYCGIPNFGNPANC